MTAMTISDTERREVARRLRGLDYADLQESLICAYLDALGIKGYEGWVGIAHRLADLIDPDCEEGRYSVARTVRPVDREALMALADEIEHGASSDDGEYHDLPAIMVAAVARKQMEYARRIREACGMVDAG